MKKTLKKAITVVLTINMIAFTFGCTLGGNVSTDKDDNTVHAQLSNNENPSDNTGGEENPENQQNPDNPDNGTETGNLIMDTSEFSEDSFASKVVGSYIGTDASGEKFSFSVYNFHGNLCGFGGYSYESYDDIYSFWAMEIIPEDPRDLYYENTEECRVGVLSFSVMSNVGRYWSSPVTGKINLTDEGITVTGDGDLNPLCVSGKSISLKRSDEGYFFADKLSVPSGFKGTNSDEGLYGIWRQKDSDNPWFLSFEKGDTYDKAAVYQKQAGMEVQIGAGFFETDNSGKMELVLNYPESFVTEDCNITYKLSGDTLTATGGDNWLPLYYDSEMVFERVSENDIPIAMLCEPDDVNAIKGDLSLNMGSVKRDIIVNFKKTDDVENNGTDFVRVGDLVFFRYYDESVLGDDSIDAEWAEFTSCYQLNPAGCVCYYDKKTGECGLAYRDYCGGSLYYVDGKFYSERFDANDTYSVEYLMSCYPDGSALEEKSDVDTFSVIEAVSEQNDCIAVYRFLSNELYSDFGNAYCVYYDLDDDNYIRYSKYYDNYYYVVTDDSTGNNLILWEFEKTSGDRLLLAEVDVHGLCDYGFPSVNQIEIEGNDIYVGFNWYDGTNIGLQGCSIFKATRGKQNSGKIVYNDFPDNMNESSRPYFYLNASDEIVFTEINPEGEVRLSEKSYGDLSFYDSPFGATILEEGFIQAYPFDGDDGTLTTVFQEGEYVNNLAFVITANGSYAPSKDIGWRRVYEFNGFTYMVLDPNDENNRTYLKPDLK